MSVVRREVEDCVGLITHPEVPQSVVCRNECDRETSMIMMMMMMMMIRKPWLTRGCCAMWRGGGEERAQLPVHAILNFTASHKVQFHGAAILTHILKHKLH